MFNILELCYSKAKSCQAEVIITKSEAFMTCIHVEPNRVDRTQEFRMCRCETIITMKRCVSEEMRRVYCEMR